MGGAPRRRTNGSEDERARAARRVALRVGGHPRRPLARLRRYWAAVGAVAERALCLAAARGLTSSLMQLLGGDPTCLFARLHGDAGGWAVGGPQSIDGVGGRYFRRA